MTPRWALLSMRERDAYRLVVAFLSARMSERGTLDWALQLTRGDAAKRLAVLDAVDSPEGQKLTEPWRSAWRLVEESWDYPVTGDASIEIYHVKQRLHSGDRSGSLIAELVRLVEPRLSVKPLSERTLSGQKKRPSRPKRVGDLLYAGLTSGEAVDPSILEVPTFGDRAFLAALARRLEAAVGHGLDIGRRIGWDGTRRLWQLGQLHRVYYVPATDRPAGDHEPDQFHRGIAPSTKLLYSIVARLADVDLSAGLEFARRWRVSESPIYQRLWAAVARDPRLATQTELVDFFGSLDDRLFWNLHDFPEVAELRAKRFGELGTPMQNVLISRIKKRPPRKQWPGQADPERVERGRWFWAGRELRRIEIGGFTLAADDKAWLDSRVAQFPELAHMNRVDEGFLAAAKAYWVAPSPDSRFDSLKGVERLVALEASLSSTQSSVAENPAKGASDWMRQPDNLLQVLSDLESAPGAGSSYPRVWEQFGWSHASSIQQAATTESRDLSTEANRVSILLASLSDKTVKHAIDGISEWLSTWRKHVVALRDYQALWHRVWPLAVEATNSQQSSADIVDLNTVARAADDSEPMDLDTLNTPSGKLVGVFLEACPSLTPGSHPFQDDLSLLNMRTAVMNAPGRTSVIVRHRLIEELPYFFTADPTWAREYLVTPLMRESAEALALWRAIAHQTQFYDVLKVIGEQMADRAVRRDLGRETRQSLVFSLVVESLWALQAQREPAVPYARVQQMIRSLDDEVRAHAADTIHRFVASVPSSPQDKASSLTPEIIFRNAAAPFLGQVWPQERSLTTPGVSRGLAQLPAVTKDAFAEAVNAIGRFLVPFDCWSMLDYGLYGDEDGSPKLSGINTEAKASSLLQLLDRTIGTSEAAVVPYDLASALDQIQEVSAPLVESPIFRRLAAAARRT
jgi:hypothetical protein